ncbi:MAG: pantoate--beta-alanine ligase [Nocardiopsaceae bacterium]|nr:pantoate--beta-alanine ligase [Nocardiopsaceae bacterium]
MIVAHTRAELARARQAVQGPVVLVPTMGALHDGHRALLQYAREVAGDGGSTVLSVFVNPLQFGPNEDLGKYPRTLPEDLKIAEAERADLVFAPGVADMYPREQLVTVDPGPVGRILEGAHRPGHFAGVLTVVLKLFMLVRPDIAVFGQKDAQQLALLRRMAEDFALGVEIRGVPTVRAGDGLALSSRNKYLSNTERTLATALHRALSAGAAAAPHGPAAVLEAARAVIEEAGDDALAADYVELVDFETGQFVRDTDVEGFKGFEGTATLAIAARVGATRLIDNVPVRFDAASD